MKYELRVLAIGHSKSVDLTADEFNEIKRAKSILGEALDFVECFEVLLKSFRTLDMAKYERVLDFMIYDRFGYENLLETRIDLSASLLGYLTAARLFVDSMPSVLSRVLDAEARKRWKKMTSEIYDNSLPYRFIEALRNHSQHHKLPIHRITHHAGLEDSKNRESDHVYAISIGAQRKELEKDSKFKKALLEELPDTVDLIDYSRSHLEGLGTLYRFVASELKEPTQWARSLIEQTTARFVAATDDRPLGLHASRISSTGKRLEDIPLLLDWDDARMQMMKTFKTLSNFQRRYISTKIRPDWAR